MTDKTLTFVDDKYNNQTYFPDDIWNIIKSYAGVYNISTNWDLMKLTYQELFDIIYIYVNNDIEYDTEFNYINKRTHGSLKTFLIKYFWKNVNGKHLYDIYYNYTSKFCKYNHKLYNIGDIYLLDGYKNKIQFTVNFCGKSNVHKEIVYTKRNFIIINITNNYVELKSIKGEYDKESQIIRLKRNIDRKLLIK